MRSLSRRDFVQLTMRSGIAALAAKLPFHGKASATGAAPQADRPNILVVLVDQMRYLQWFEEAGNLDALPNIQRIAQGAVDFSRHYIAAAACTPSRGCMLTGLYTHQTYCMITNTSHLHPDFPTWGTYLRQFGYTTHWFGKWHCSEHDCSGSTPPYTYLDPYGFDSYTCPDPHGAPGQGLLLDDDIAGQFANWLQNQGSQATTPWCATVSFVNPHDIMFYPRLIPHQERTAPQVFSSLPPNFETATQLVDKGKPRIQTALIEAANRQFGVMGYQPSHADEWIRMLDVYLYMQQLVDQQVGVVLDALDAHPEIKGNTVVIFTSDHGDYCGSHGLRGKGGAAYEESIWVPFYLHDYSGKLGVTPGQRTQLTSHVDLTPLLMTIGYGGDGWRTLPEASHLADRLDMLAIAQDPGAPGRDYVLHTSDETGLEEKDDPQYDWIPFNDDVPNHIICYRNTAGKFSTYSYWREGSSEILSEGQEVECYDYATEQGRMELDNITDAGNALYATLQESLEAAIPSELRAPLPAHLQDAQFAAYLQYLRDVGQGSQIFLPQVARG